MTTGARVLVCGDRDWDDEYIIGILLTGIRYWIGPPTYIYHGACRGADNLFSEVAKDVFEGAITPIPFPAEWKKYGKSAGPRRNKKMLKTMLDDLEDNQVYFAVALHDDLEKSRGTRNMANQCKKAGVPVYVVGRY